MRLNYNHVLMSALPPFLKWGDISAIAHNTPPRRLWGARHRIWTRPRYTIYISYENPPFCILVDYLCTPDARGLASFKLTWQRYAFRIWLDMDFLAQYGFRMTLIAINVICYSFVFYVLVKSVILNRSHKKPASPHGRHPYSRLKPSQGGLKLWNI